MLTSSYKSEKAHRAKVIWRQKEGYRFNEADIVELVKIV